MFNNGDHACHLTVFWKTYRTACSFTSYNVCQQEKTSDKSETPVRLCPADLEAGSRCWL